MLLRKEGFPEEDEIVLCTVTAIHHHSVFVTLDEYDKSGMIHISEISPGRIRNLRDFVKEGKKVVCKVLRIHEDKGHIDLSLRRVNEGQRKEKVNSLKQEQMAEKIVEFVAKQRNTDLKTLYDELTKKIFEEYDSLFSAFEDAALGKVKLEDLGVAADLAGQIMSVVSQRIKPAEIEVGGTLKLQSYEPNGVEIIKGAVKKAGKKAEIKYKGAGAYGISITSMEYKDAEKDLKHFVDTITDYMESHHSKAVFKREEK
ncbi:translation initiation factor IF-2 subunit alpha [Candidatus Woesearchaeota archaeon]|nr:translation initiation factor IF-2 subunit alpha [Candidatus Woesearchaeota archaeon]